MLIVRATAVPGTQNPPNKDFHLTVFSGLLYAAPEGLPFANDDLLIAAAGAPCARFGLTLVEPISEPACFSGMADKALAEANPTAGLFAEFFRSGACRFMFREMVENKELPAFAVLDALDVEAFLWPDLVEVGRVIAAFAVQATTTPLIYQVLPGHQPHTFEALVRLGMMTGAKRIGHAATFLLMHDLLDASRSYIASGNIGQH